MEILLLTACALAMLPRNTDRAHRAYESIFSAIEELELGYEALEQMFRRMAFNIYIREMDDHSKNFSFMMDEHGHWSLAPAYDLTGIHFSNEDQSMFDWINQHALSVNGKFSAVKDEDLLSVAGRYGIGTAKKILAKMKDALT